MVAVSLTRRSKRSLPRRVVIIDPSWRARSSGATDESNSIVPGLPPPRTITSPATSSFAPCAGATWRASATCATVVPWPTITGVPSTSKNRAEPRPGAGHATVRIRASTTAAISTVRPVRHQLPAPGSRWRRASSPAARRYAGSVVTEGRPCSASRRACRKAGASSPDRRRDRAVLAQHSRSQRPSSTSEWGTRPGRIRRSSTTPS